MTESSAKSCFPWLKTGPFVYNSKNENFSISLALIHHPQHQELKSTYMHGRISYKMRREVRIWKNKERVKAWILPLYVTKGVKGRDWVLACQDHTRIKWWCCYLSERARWGEKRNREKCLCFWFLTQALHVCLNRKVKLMGVLEIKEGGVGEGMSGEFKFDFLLLSPW
jgi:hypothetical protein